MTLRKAIKIILPILMVSYIGVAYMLSNKVLEPNSSFEKTLHDIENYWGTTYEEMMALLPDPQPMALTSADGTSISGQYFSVSDSAQCVFIFSHGWGRSWHNMLKYYPMVEDCNCNVVMYDHRAHGESGGDFPTGGIKEADDLIAVTMWVTKNKGYSLDQMAWLGSSWGASTALIAGAKGENPAFIVADSPFQDWYSAIFERAIKDYGAGIKVIAPGVMAIVNLRTGINYRDASPLKWAEGIEAPVLLIHSEGDPKTNSQQSVRISEMLNEQSEFHHTSWDNIHVMDVINNKEDLKQILNAFIIKNKFSFFLPVKTDTLDYATTN
ncbi:MAG: alpha/beta hydrolase [Ekhidna sp.]